ncbi:MAG: hypothetical protein HGA37_09670 [Lentimicrobium sp.]|nr:hypothetical protein [Lentimicrobium sp.]
MKKLQFISAILFASILLTTISCSKENESDEALSSNAGGTKSHKTGENCMSCHKSGGEGEGRFALAGSVFNVQQSGYSNAVVKLYTEANGSGTLKATLNGDARGNFYTTSGVDFTGGLYVAVAGTGGNVVYMNSPVTSGACNSCHGSSTSKIILN